LICFNHSKTIILFSPTRGIQSATVQIAAISILSVKYLSLSSSFKNISDSAVINLNATHAQERSLNGYSQSSLFGFIIAAASSGIISGTA
jgi:hypothetical protein